MKKLAGILIISVSLFSCVKDGIRNITPGVGGGTGIQPRSFTATINGVAFTADSAWYNNFNAGATNIFAVKGTGATLQYFEINLNGQTATTYAIPPNAFTYLTSSNTYVATGGSLSISNYDMINRRISGSFTGITAGGVTITNGSFSNLPYK